MMAHIENVTLTFPGMVGGMIDTNVIPRNEPIKAHFLEDACLSPLALRAMVGNDRDTTQHWMQLLAHRKDYSLQKNRVCIIFLSHIFSFFPTRIYGRCSNLQPFF